MLLAIDIGNTRIKAAVFEGNTVLKSSAFTETLQQNVFDLLQEFPSISDIVVSSVGNDSISFALPETIRLHIIAHDSQFPFTNLYETPKTLGIDRMVMAAGAVILYPGTNRLVIGAGTCITYDFIDEYNNYHGGAISPGIGLRYRSLHDYTANLPLLSIAEPKAFLGTSSAESMHSGIVNGIVHEIDGFVADYAAVHSNFTIILTGGDAVFLAKRLKNTIFAHSNFLLESLNQTFQYKIKND